MPGMSYLPELLVGGGRGWRSLVQVTVIALSYPSELKGKTDPKAEDITLSQQKVENPKLAQGFLAGFLRTGKCHSGCWRRNVNVIQL